MNWILIYSIVVIVPGLWFWDCINRTYAQKMRLLDRVSALARADQRDDWRRFFRRLCAVSFERHFWHLFTFRDPMKLYRLEDDQDGAGQ